MRTGPVSLKVVNHRPGFTITWSENGQGHRVTVATAAEVAAITQPLLARIVPTDRRANR